MDYNPKWSGGSDDPTCASCHLPITAGQHSQRIDFANDPRGHRGLSGTYHAECAKPFDALARAVNAMSFPRF